MNRRRFAQAAAVGGPFGGFSLAADPPDRLSLPRNPSVKTAAAGLHPLNLRAERDALLYIPEAAARFDQAPLVISLHGATRSAESAIDRFKSLADQYGFLLLAPASESTTWDGIGGQYGPDPAFINRSLARAFTMRSIDAARIAMAGFSDGASYSLSIGLANGGLFRAVFGFSPGFIIPGDRNGKPPVFISHGTIDNVLPIDQCSRRIVPELKRLGYNVTYREFEGKHVLPPEIASDAMSWFMSL